MDIEKIIQLIDKVSEAPITSLNIEEGSLKISIEKNNGVMQTVTSPVQVVPEMTVLPKAPVQTSVFAESLSGQEAGHFAVPSAEAEAADSEAEENFQTITSPIVGVFYAASSPQKAPFVKVGDRVSKGQVVGIIEAMKLMNEIESEVDGEIVQILVNNGEAVEYGQPLFKVR